MIGENGEWWEELVKEEVCMVGMKEDEGEGLRGERDGLLGCEKGVEWVDVVVWRGGGMGLYMGGFREEEGKRKREDGVVGGGIGELKEYEFRGGMGEKDWENGVGVYWEIGG